MKTYEQYKKEVDENYNVNYKKDGAVHYVYEVTDMNDGLKYIGRRKSKIDNLEEDFYRYGTSSKRRNQILKYGKERFKVSILKTFDNMGEANIFECYMHDKLEIEKNPLYWNEARQGISHAKFFWADKRFTLYDSEEKRYRKVEKSEYEANKERYKSHFSGRLWVVEKESGEGKFVSKEEYSLNRDKYVKNSDGKIVATDLETGVRTLVDKNEFVNNPKKYKKAGAGTLTAIDKNGEFVRISKEEYNSNKNLYKISSSGVVYATDLGTGETLTLNPDEYKKMKESGKVTTAVYFHTKNMTVLDTLENRMKRVPVKEWENDKKRYKHCSTREAKEFRRLNESK